MARKATAEVINIGGEVPTTGANEIIPLQSPIAWQSRSRAPLTFFSTAGTSRQSKRNQRPPRAAPKKKSDNIESYVYRNEQGEICIPGEYLRGAIIQAAKYRQDPRSPRKSAMDLFKAGIVSLTSLAPVSSAAGGVKHHPATTWDYEDKHRVIIQRSAVTRIRPALRLGWTVGFDFLVTLPEYISPQIFNEVSGAAGRLVGIGDFRPTYGRFVIVKFERLSA